jgi:hypothetical protein
MKRGDFDFGTRMTITPELNIDTEARATRAWHGSNTTLTPTPNGLSDAITLIEKQAGISRCGV